MASLELTPRKLSLAAGTSSDVQATLLVSDGTTADVTSDATWVSNAPEVATVAGGTVSGLKRGTAEITVTASSLVATLTVTVTESTLLSLSITPPRPMLARGLEMQLSATGVFTDNTTQDLTKQVTWTSVTKTVASVSSAGLLTAVSVGSTNVSAKFGTVSATALVTVSAAVLDSIALTPPEPSMPKGTTRALTATATLSDGTTEAVTDQAEWTSTDESVATVNSSGVVTAIAVGTSTISASVAGVTGSTKVTVVGASLLSIGVTPAAPSVVKGLTRQFTATGTFSDSTVLDLTSQVTWSSNANLVATISNAAGSHGLAATNGVGSASISATFTGVSGSTTLTVTAATLVSIGVTPAAPSVAKGLTQQFSATGTYTDASTQNLTTAATWASSDTEKATISNAAGSQGLATTAAVGPTSISATLLGVTGTTALTVSPAMLVSIVVTPATPSVAKGLTQQFTAVGSYTDSSTQNLTATATWASSDPTKATISNAVGSQGLATATDVGTASISATFSGVGGSTTLTVTAPMLLSIAVTPANSWVFPTQTRQFTAIGTYTGGSTQDLTTSATWASSKTEVTISNAIGSKGLATADNSYFWQSTQISATLGATVGSTTLFLILD